MKFLEHPALLLSLAVAACGGGSTTSKTSTTAPLTASTRADDPSCPVGVPGTSVTVEDAPDGAALVFVTTGDVGDVRRRASEMASMHNDHHGSMGPLPDGEHAGDGHAGHAGHTGHDVGGHAGHAAGQHAGHDTSKHAGHAGGMIGVHSKAATSEIDGGAKITFVANGPDVAKLQSELRRHAQHLATGTCRMNAS